MIYTSYFGNISNIPSNLRLFSVSSSIPRNFKYPVEILRPLVPNSVLLTDFKCKLESEIGFRRRYLKYLNSVSALDWRKCLFKMTSGDCVLLSWEGKNRFNHRQILSDYMLIKFNLDVTEL